MRSVEDTGTAALVAAVSLARRETEEAIVEAVTAARREARADKEQALAQLRDSLMLEARAALDAARQKGEANAASELWMPAAWREKMHDGGAGPSSSKAPKAPPKGDKSPGKPSPRAELVAAARTEAAVMTRAGVYNSTDAGVVASTATKWMAGANSAAAAQHSPLKLPTPPPQPPLPPPLSVGVQDGVQYLRSVLAENHSRVVDLFRQWDRNGDGRCTKTEVRRALEVLGHDGVPEVELDGLFSILDINGNGFVEYNELHSVLKFERRVHTPPSTTPRMPPLSEHGSATGPQPEYELRDTDSPRRR